MFTHPETVEDNGELLRGRLVLLGDVAMPMDPYRRLLDQYAQLERRLAGDIGGDLSL